MKIKHLLVGLIFSLYIAACSNNETDNAGSNNSVSTSQESQPIDSNVDPGQGKSDQTIANKQDEVSPDIKMIVQGWLTMAQETGGNSLMQLYENNPSVNQKIKASGLKTDAYVRQCAELLTKDLPADQVSKLSKYFGEYISAIEAKNAKGGIKRNMTSSEQRDSLLTFMDREKVSAVSTYTENMTLAINGCPIGFAPEGSAPVDLSTDEFSKNELKIDGIGIGSNIKDVEQKLFSLGATRKPIVVGGKEIEGYEELRCKDTSCESIAGEYPIAAFALFYKDSLVRLLVVYGNESESKYKVFLENFKSSFGTPQKSMASQPLLVDRTVKADHGYMWKSSDGDILELAISSEVDGRSTKLTPVIGITDVENFKVFNAKIGQ